MSALFEIALYGINSHVFCQNSLKFSSPQGSGKLVRSLPKHALILSSSFLKLHMHNFEDNSFIDCKRFIVYLLTRKGTSERQTESGCMLKFNLSGPSFQVKLTS